ncbi:hypothetical protein HYT57_05495 [Candidatus Woesearchaeota archaeon]|nr:hypothetical protein [Candidatus Woesearchaeota archaeon]
MKKSIVFISLIALIIISGCIQNQNKLPDNFTIVFYGDLSSSGGTRVQDARLTFLQGNIVSGWQRYEHGGIIVVDSCTVNRETKSWKGEDGNECKIQDPFPLTKAELQQLISLEGYEPYNKCGFRDICYSIFTTE